MKLLVINQTRAVESSSSPLVTCGENTSKRRVVRFLSLVCTLLLLVFSTFNYAQTTGSATLRGTVYDPQRAVIPGAQVRLINERTGIERTAISGADGSYYFTAVNPGTCTLVVEITGFNGYRETGIELRANDARRIDVELKIGETADTVTVTGGATEIVETESGAKQYTLDAQMLENLSLIGRAPNELLRILPGVVAPSQTAMMTVSMQGDGRFDGYSVNGHNGNNNRFQLDGSRIQHQGDTGTQMLVMNNDMLQEVRIQTSNYSAEYGSSGIQVTGITKSGSRDFHGTLYDYLRPNALTANDRSNNYVGTPKPNNRYQYIGGNVGGPLSRSRDKLFFFFGAEIQRQTVDNGTFLAVVPTLRQRQGDFSELLTAPSGSQLFNQPRTVRIPKGYLGEGNPAPNNNLAPYATRLGLGLMGLYPKSNYTHPNGRYNFFGQNLFPVNRHTEVGRVDYKISDQTLLYVRLAHDSEKLEQPFGSWFKASDIPNSGGVVGTGRGESVAVSLVNILSPTITSELLLSTSANQLVHDYTRPAEVSLAAVNGEDFVAMFPPTGRAPAALFSQAFPGGNLRQQQNLPLTSQIVDLAASENLTFFTGKHALKLGFHWETTMIRDNNGNCQDGCIDLNASVTPGSTGNDFGDLLVGRPFQFRQVTPISQAHWRQSDLELYAQDSWKMRPNLTLDYGLRISYFPLGYDTRGRSTVFNPSTYDRTQGLLIGGDPTRPNGIQIASRDGLPDAAITGPGIAWSPRLGFAWDISGSGSTVVRGGFGVFHNRPNKNFIGSPQNTNPPFTYSAAIDAISGANLGKGVGLTYDTIREVNPFSRITSVSLTAQGLDSAHNQNSMSMSVSVARRLPGEQVLEVAYVGTLSRHLAVHRPRNVIPEGALLRGTVGNADLSIITHRVALSTQAKNSFKPFPAYADVLTGEYENTANYHALQLTLSRKTTKDLTYLLSYTFSKTLGTGTGRGSNSYNAPFGGSIDPFDTRGRSYGYLSTDRTHILNLSYIYELPRLTDSSGFLNGVLNGWRISGIASYISSPPLRLTLTGAIANPGIAQAYFGTDATRALSPVFTADPRLSGSHLGERRLGANALAMPLFGSLGPYQPPYYLRAQATSNLDLTLFKDFRLGTESRKLQLRFAAFNLFNQAFAGPGDIITGLQTTCNKTVNGIPNGSGGRVNNVCDPSGGFSFTQTSLNTFGTIITKRGRRILEVVVKFYF